MKDGRPIFTQDEALLEEASQEQEQQVEAEKRKEVDPIANKLRYSISWSDDPQVPGQAKLYPETVKTVAIRYRVFDVKSESDMAQYSAICLSHASRGHFLISSGEDKQWDADKKTWLILMQVHERMFKTLKTSSLDPQDP